MRIAVGANHSGYLVREMLIEMIGRLQHEIIDLGVFNSRPVDYPEIAARVAELVGSGHVDRGILIGGTGLGMCIAANKVAGVRSPVSRRYDGPVQPFTYRLECPLPISQFAGKSSHSPYCRYLAEDALRGRSLPGPRGQDHAVGTSVLIQAVGDDQSRRPDLILSSPPVGLVF